MQRLASFLPFAARQGSRAREWLSLLVHAVADARPPLPVSGQGRAADENATVLPLETLVRAACAAVGEQAAALRNHPNAALYAAIVRLVPRAGHYLELEPCLVCLERDGRGGGGGGGGGGKETEPAASPSSAPPPALASGGTGAVTTAAGAPGAGIGARRGGGSGPVFLNYPLDSIKAASKSTENAMLVREAKAIRFFIPSFSDFGFQTGDDYTIILSPILRTNATGISSQYLTFTQRVRACIKPYPLQYCSATRSLQRFN